MNNKFFMGVAVLGLVFLGVIAFKPAPKSSSLNLGSANVSNQGGLDQQSLINELNLIANPLVAIYSSSSANYTPPLTLGPIGSTTSTASSTLTFTSASGGPFTVGDLLEVGEATTTASVYFNAQVVNSSTLQISAFNLGLGNDSLTAATLYVKDLPQATFIAPTGL